MSDACANFEESPLVKNGICIKCYRHQNSHKPVDPFYTEKSLRTQIEDTLYYANELPDHVNSYIFSLLQNIPPPQIYYKIFNVYSYVSRNLTNPQLIGMKHEEKLIAIFQGVDFLLLIALPLRRPPSFEKVSKLRRNIPDMQKAERLDGTIDVINKLGYTVVTRDHFEFPQEIHEAPDQNFIREIIADLTIAMTEIKYYHDKRHPNPERFSERSEWAKKTTPILVANDPENFVRQRSPDPPTPVILPPVSISNVLDLSCSYTQPSPVGTRPPPVPLNTIECPFCQTVLPKKTTVCSKCRKCLPQIQFPPTIDLIPVEEWICKACTMKNSTARGRTRICSMCQINDDISRLDITQPKDPVPKDNKPSYDRHDTLPEERVPDSSMGPTRDPSVTLRPRDHSVTSRPRDHSMSYMSRDSSMAGADSSVHFTFPKYTEASNQPRPVDHPTVPTGPSGPYGDYQIPPLKEYDVTMRGHPNDHYPYSRGNPDTQLMYVDPKDTSMYHQPFDPAVSYTTYSPSREKYSQNLISPGYHQEPKMPFHLYQQPKQAPHKRVKYILSQNTAFKDESIQLAIKKCGTLDCLEWLKSEFRENIEILTNDIQKFNLCQTVTYQDVEESYIAYQGDMTNVLPDIHNSRVTKLDELVASLNVKVKDTIAISSLDETNWEISAAYENIVLNCNQEYINTYKDNLWRVGITIPEQEKAEEDVDPTLWQELTLFVGGEIEMNNKIVRKFLCELKVPSFIHLNLLLQLLMSEETKDKQPNELLQAVKENAEFDAAVKFLNQECSICLEEYTANDMIQMFFCEHSACKGCIIDHFTGVIRGAAIKNWVCFACGEPDITQMDDPSDYFALLSNVVQVMCEPDVSGLFHQKVNEFYFSKRPEFRWCPHCHSGFMGLEGEKKLRCPQEECQQYMCYICKNKWHAEHEGKTCEEFQQWRDENDRDILDKGLAAKMVEEGIECPSCKFKYELARGGCMHFRCTQCPAEFCSGCFQLFKKDNCTKFPSCAKKGLHAHHPRNCQYFTRDMDIAKMKELLEFGGFLSDAAVLEAPAPADGAPANHAKKQQIYKIRVPDEHRNRVIEELTVKMGAAFAEPPPGELKIPCQIVEYKESPDGAFEKEDCSKSSLEKDGYAGLCDKHYKEYLCGLITKAGLDPIDVLQVTEESIYELFAILRRNEIPFDDKMKGDALKLLIKEKLPLQAMKVKGALQA